MAPRIREREDAQGESHCREKHEVLMARTLAADRDV
jgi:hypothetical protein